MWCLETINNINQQLANGKTLDEAYKLVGILKSDRQPKSKFKNMEQFLCGNKKSPVKVA